jgi:hypothetical protein
MADARSELYALGCLLWQLLTSRPVVLTAEPVTRLMKQKDHDIVDVRGPVPDCPEWMSRIIVSMTRRSPELRPASAAEVLKLWRSHSGNGHSQCRALARSMPDQSDRGRARPVMRTAGKKSSILWPTAATAVLATLVVLAARSGVLPKTLRLGPLAELATSLTSASGAPTHQTAATTETAPTGPLPLPAVDADGLIRLKGGVTYVAEPRESPGSLRILCEESPTAKVLVKDSTRWQLRARTVELRGISLSSSAQAAPVDSTTATSRPAKVLLEVLCASLTMSDCVVQSPAQADDFEGIAWFRPTGSEGVVIVRNTVFAGGGYGLSLNHPPRRFELENVLLANRGSGLLCEFQKNDSDTLEISCTNVTQRFGFSLMDAVVHDGAMKRVHLNLTSTECVYSPQMAVLRLQGPPSLQSSEMHVKFRSGETGNPAIVPPDAQAVVYIDRQLNQPVSLPESQITDNSLLLAELFFDDSESSVTESRPSVSEWASSALTDFDGAKLSPVMPGVDVNRLPVQSSTNP